MQKPKQKDIGYRWSVAEHRFLLARGEQTADLIVMSGRANTKIPF
jgi:hypothetical protein